MKQLMQVADAYMKRMTLWDMGLVKICMCAIGVLLGSLASFREIKVVRTVAGLIFVATYVTVMVRFVLILGEELSRRRC